MASPHTAHSEGTRRPLHGAGITVNQLKGCSGQPNPDNDVPIIPALLCVLGTVSVPAAASVYNEFAMKKHMDTSVHLQNFFLYFYGAVFNGIFLLGAAWWKSEALGDMFNGEDKDDKDEDIDSAHMGHGGVG